MEFLGEVFYSSIKENVGIRMPGYVAVESRYHIIEEEKLCSSENRSLHILVRTHWMVSLGVLSFSLVLFYRARCS